LISIVLGLDLVNYGLGLGLGLGALALTPSSSGSRQLGWGGEFMASAKR